MTRLRLGACLSLTGRFGRFGRQAANGLLAWQRLAGDEVELEIEDDGSDPDRFAAGFPGVAARADLLLGPYSTQLMRRAAEAMSETDGVLWNHGGAGDDVQALCPGHVISVPAPTSRYALPFLRTRTETERVPLWVVRGPGDFGRQAAVGAVAEAERAGLETVDRRAAEGSTFDDVPEAWDLLVAGRFEDDVAIVKAARSAARPPRAICSIAAGVHDFASQLDQVDGVCGVAQWFPGGRAGPPGHGPAEDVFVAAYHEVAGSRPDYPAVQAAAGAVLATHCARLTGSLDRDALWQAAVVLDTSTLLGGFRIDPFTGAQVEHTATLVRWDGGVLGLAAR